MVKEWSDMVLFANYKTYVVNVDNQGTQKGKNKAQGGKRVMYTTHHPCWDAKNRHELAPELPFAYQEIAHCVSVMERDVPPVQAPPAQETPPPAPESEPAQEETPEPQPQPQPGNDTGLPKALVDLMIHDMVTVQEIQEAVAAKQYFPKDMPVADYPEDFINGVLIGAWPQVLAMVQAARPPEYKATGTPF